MHNLRAAILAVPLAACFLAHPIERPTVQARNVSIATASLTAVEGQLDLDVQNPNGFAVPLSSIDWQFSIAGTSAVSGRVDLSQTIPAKASAAVSTSLRIDLREAVAAATALARGARDYQLQLRLNFATQLGDVTVDLDHRGQLSAGSLLDNLPRW
jgi:LEA14-like dessication related protein